MKYIDEIKSAIAEVIKPNGNQEITGQVLQDILVSVVGKLGQAFDSQIGANAQICNGVTIGTGATIDEVATIAKGVIIGTNARIGGDVSNVSIGAGGVIIPGYLSINCVRGSGGHGTIYLGTDNQFSEDIADSLTQLPLGLRIAYNLAGITFRTPEGQITLNYGS